MTLLTRRLSAAFLAIVLICGLSTQAGKARAAASVLPLPPNQVTPVSGHRNNIFYVGQPVTFTLNRAGAVSYDVRDYWGGLVDQGAAGTSLRIRVSQPGWYKLNLYGGTSVTPWGTVVGGGTFVIFRPDAHFPVVQDPTVNGTTDPAGADDAVLRGVTALGPQRHYVPDAGQPDQAIGSLAGGIALDKQYSLGFNDPVRPRDLLIAFPNGTSDLGGVAKIVGQFQNDVRYWEPRNEPNGGATGSGFAINEMKPFYQAVKGVNPSLKVIGPGTVSVNPGTLGWLNDFFQAGGGDYIDAFSFHAYNMTNGDLSLARTSLGTLRALLAQYGQEKKEVWQTEQGFMAPVYGAYEPRHQGRWTMLQMMAFEQYGITKEHNHLWYDKSHGFWDEPMFTENDDGTLNPVAPLMRVWSEELYGTRFVQAYDLGDPGNKLYLGSLFQGDGKSVAAFMSAGGTDGQITLQVSGGDHLHVVSAFGVESDLPMRNGQATLPVPEIPVYVEIATGQTITPVPVDWGPNLALLPGVTAQSSGASAHPLDAGAANDINKIHNGTLENWYWSQQSNDRPWMSNVSAFPAWAELDLPVPQSIGKVVLYCPVPWQWDGALLDYELQYDNNGQWVTIDHVQEDPKTFPLFSPSVRCTVDSFYSDRCIFTHQFAPVITGKIRVLVHDCTWGGGATQDVVNAGGQTGPHQFSIREIEVYPADYNAAQTVKISGRVADGSGQGVAGVTMTLTGSQSRSVVTDATGRYAFPPLPRGGTYTITPAMSDYTFSARSQTYSALAADQNANFQASQVPSGSGTGLRADYYSSGYDVLNNPFAAKYHSLTRVDACINFPDWFHSTPAPTVGPQYFAVRWTGQIEPRYSENYTFTTVADDGMRVWIDGQLVIDHWGYTVPPTSSGTIALAAGRRVDIKVEYYQTAGGATAQLFWASPSQSSQIVPQKYLYPPVVDVPPAVGISAPGISATARVGDGMVVTAVAADSDGTVAQVTFFANGVRIGTCATSPYSVNWTPAAAGPYALTAVATDDQGAATTSDPVSVTAVRLNLLPTVTLTSPTRGTSITVGATAPVCATAADSDGTVAQVTFFANGVRIGTCATSPYSVNWTPAAAGPYALTAVATDDQGAATASNSLGVVAVNGKPLVTLTSPKTAAVASSRRAVVLTATALEPGGSIAKVAFYANGALVGTSNASPYSVTWNQSLTVRRKTGLCSLTAVATDAGGSTATSPSVTIMIQQ